MHVELSAKKPAKKAAPAKAAAKKPSKAAKKAVAKAPAKKATVKKTAKAPAKKPAAKKAAPAKRTTKQVAPAAIVPDSKKGPEPVKTTAPVTKKVAKKRSAPVVIDGKGPMSVNAGDLSALSAKELEELALTSPLEVFDSALLGTKIAALLKQRTIRADVMALDLPGAADLLANIGDLTLQGMISDINASRTATGRTMDPRAIAVVRTIAKVLGKEAKLSPADVREQAQAQLDKFMVLEKAGNDEETLAAIAAFAASTAIPQEVKSAVVLSAAYSRDVDVPPYPAALRQKSLIERVLKLAIVPHVLAPKRPAANGEVIMDRDNDNPGAVPAPAAKKKSGRRVGKKSAVAAPASKDDPTAGSRKFDAYFKEAIAARVGKDEDGFAALMARLGDEDEPFVRYVAHRLSSNNMNLFSAKKAAALAFIRRRWSETVRGNDIVNHFTGEVSPLKTGVTKTKLKAPPKATTKKAPAKKPAAKRAAPAKKPTKQVAPAAKKGGKVYFTTVGPDGSVHTRGSQHDYGYTHAAWYKANGKWQVTFSTSKDGALKNAGVSNGDKREVHVSKVTKSDTKPEAPMKKSVAKPVVKDATEAEKNPKPSATTKQVKKAEGAKPVEQPRRATATKQVSPATTGAKKRKRVEVSVKLTKARKKA